MAKLQVGLRIKPSLSLRLKLDVPLTRQYTMTVTVLLKQFRPFVKWVKKGLGHCSQLDCFD
jgi:hypothetical protein